MKLSFDYKVCCCLTPISSDPFCPSYHWSSLFPPSPPRLNPTASACPDSPQTSAPKLLEALLCPYKVEGSSGNVFPVSSPLPPPSLGPLANAWLIPNQTVYVFALGKMPRGAYLMLHSSPLGSFKLRPGRTLTEIPPLLGPPPSLPSFPPLSSFSRKCLLNKSLGHQFSSLSLVLEKLT